MCSRSGSLSAQARLKTFAERGTEECLVRRLVGGISIGGPLRPTPPSLPPPSSSSPPLCARFYNFLAGHKAARARSPNGEDSSPPSRVIYPRAASRMRRKCEKALLPLPSPHPLHLPPSSRAEPKRNQKTVARNSPIPRRFIAFVDRKARRGPHARAPLSLPHQGRDTHREKGQGGGLCAQRIPRRDYFRARFSIPLNSSNAALLLCVRTISAHYLFRLCPWTRSTRDLVGSRFFREMERGNRLERYIYSFSFYFRRMDRWLVDFKKW